MFFPKTLLLASVSLSLFLATTTFASPVKLDASERFDSAPGNHGAAVERVEVVSPGLRDSDPFVVNPPRLTRRQEVYDEVRGHRSAGSSHQDRKRSQPHFNDQGDIPPGGGSLPQGHGLPESDNPPEGHGPPGPWMKRSLAEQEQSVAAASYAHQLSHPAVADLQERDAESDEDEFFGDEFDEAGRDPGLEKRDVEDNDVNMPIFWETAPEPKVPKHPYRTPRSVELQEKRDVKDDSSDEPGPGGAPGWNGNPAPNPVFPKPPKHPHRPPDSVALYERNGDFDPPYARFTPQDRTAQPAAQIERRDSKQERDIESEAFHWSWAPRGDKGTPLYHGAEPRPHIGPHKNSLESRDSESVLSDVDEDEDEERDWIVHEPSHEAREGRRDGPNLARRYRPSGGYVPPEGRTDEQPPTSGTHGTSDADGPPLARRAYFPGPGNEPWASTGQSGGSGSSRSGDGGPSRRSLVDENGVRFVGAKRSEQQSVNDAHLDSVPHSPYIPRPPPDDDGSGWDNGGPKPWWDHYSHGGRSAPPGQANEHGVRYVGAKRSEPESVSGVVLDSVSDAKYSHLPDPDPINGGTGWNGGPVPWGRGGRRPPAEHVNENAVRFTGSKRSVETEEVVGERHIGKRSSLPGDDGGVLEDVSDQSQRSGASKVSDPYNRGCTKWNGCNGRPHQVKFAKRDNVNHEGDQTPPAHQDPAQPHTDPVAGELKQNPQQFQTALVDSSNPSYTSLISPAIYITSSLEHQPTSALGFYGICRCDRFPDDGKLDGQSSSTVGSCVSRFVEIASKTAKCKFSTIAEVDCVEVGGKDQMTDGDNFWWQEAFCKRCVDAGGVSDASFKCPSGYASDGKVIASDGDDSAGMGQRNVGEVESEKRSSEKRSGLVPGSDQVAGQSRTDPEQDAGAQQ
ncbi:hypothetical protein PHSY_002624 [Pseudozyma hubeiensis SY62]|uniref:Uncharacterized protein n=1 Tax=Pseudozyma hubeiensis (strain SY62) TaxID=1305764 RepID=R9P1J0_PSEHS|nr:hypothetical protein PHSY_002624 [Pseudozyma hubeiensis SY62]GAC95049.1 hypothetical protein PHSY_002624 [Pseudozyma hubeiensis SY62]